MNIFEELKIQQIDKNDLVKLVESNTKPNINNLYLYT